MNEPVASLRKSTYRAYVVIVSASHVWAFKSGGDGFWIFLVEAKRFLGWQGRRSTHMMQVFCKQLSDRVEQDGKVHTKAFSWTGFSSSEHQEANENRNINNNNVPFTWPLNHFALNLSASGKNKYRQISLATISLLSKRRSIMYLFRIGRTFEILQVEIKTPSLSYSKGSRSTEKLHLTLPHPQDGR